MRRRQVLTLAGGAALARWLPGCDQLVVLDPERLGSDLSAITPNDRFYVYDYRSTPELDPATHATALTDVADAGTPEEASTELATFDRAFLEALPARSKEHTLECIGARPTIQSIGNAVWDGLPLVEVLDALGVEVPTRAVGLRLTGVDGYHAGVPIEDLFDGPIWLVWRMNGERLPLEHGAPARLLVPGRYGVKNVKWLASIAFVDRPHTSFWTPRGWSEEAVYQPNTLIVAPRDGFRLEPDRPARFVGTAFAGPDPVVAVDVRVDGGPWEPAELAYTSPEPHTWVLWSWAWAPTEGDHTVQVRCTTASGASSVEDPAGTDPFAGYDGSMEIRVVVA